MRAGGCRAARPGGGRREELEAIKITKIGAIYVRQPEMKEQCDSGQDVLIVRISTDAGITGTGEVDSLPLAVKGAIEGPYSHNVTDGLGSITLGEDPLETEYLWEKMYRRNIWKHRPEKPRLVREQAREIREAWPS